MKKLVGVLLALLLCLSAALAESTEIAGMWYLDEIMIDGVSLEPSAFDMDMTLELRSDGSAWGMTEGAEKTGSWTANGETVAITLAGQTESFALQGGKLIGHRDNTKIILVKERLATTLPEARSDASLADFNGAWYATVVESMGMRFPVADMGMSMVITLADGVAIIDESVEEDVAVTSGTAAVESGVLTIALEDGTTIPLRLRVNGEVTYTETDDGVETIIHFERVK